MELDLLEGEMFLPFNMIDFNHYLVSNKGRVWNGKKIMKQFYTSDGYKRIHLRGGGVDKKFTVHRMVAYTFLGKPKNEKMVVNHIDSCRTNNDSTNLEWVTIKENIKHAIEHGSMDIEKLKKQAAYANLKACEARRKKVKIEKDGEINIFNSLVEAEKNTGLCRKSLGSAARGEIKHHKGFIVKYI